MHREVFYSLYTIYHLVCDAFTWFLAVSPKILVLFNGVSFNHKVCGVSPLSHTVKSNYVNDYSLIKEAM